MLAKEDFGWRPAAYQAIGRFGSTKDLPVLVRLSDFWTGDRSNHYSAMLGLSSLRGRFNYDLNGPVGVQ
jgi:hypothetical protein